MGRATYNAGSVSTTVNETLQQKLRAEIATVHTANRVQGLRATPSASRTTGSYSTRGPELSADLEQRAGAAAPSVFLSRWRSGKRGETHARAGAINLALRASQSRIAANRSPGTRRSRTSSAS